MAFEGIKLVVLILALVKVISAKPFIGHDLDVESASQQTLHRRSPNLAVQSQGYGGGYGPNAGGMSSTSLQFNQPNNYPNDGTLSVQSNAFGGGGGNKGGGGVSSTSLQFNGGKGYPDNNNAMSLQSSAFGAGGGTGGGGGTSSTSLQFNNGNNLDNNALSVQSSAMGGGGGNDGLGGGTSSTSLQFNNSGNPNDNTLSVQSNAAGVGNGANGGGGVSSTSLQFNGGDCNPNNDQLSVQSNAAGVGNGANGGGGVSSTSLQFSGGNSNPNNNQLSVQSNAAGVGDGNNGRGLSSTSLQFNSGNGNSNNEELKVNSNAVGVGRQDNCSDSPQNTVPPVDNGPVAPIDNTIQPQTQPNAVDGSVGATHTSLDTSDNNNELHLANTAVGVENNNQGVGLTDTELHDKTGDQTVDVSNTAVGTGTTGAALTNTSLQQKDGNGDETKVDTTSLGYASGQDTLGASQTTVQQVNNPNDVAGAPVQMSQDDSAIKVQTAGVSKTDQNGAVGLSTNSVHIDDDKEGGIDLNTLAMGSTTDGGSGASKVGVQVADGTDTPANNDLLVHATNTQVGDSNQGVGGSISTVQVDDAKNERSLEAQTVGLGFNSDNTSGTLTADSMKYHDVDQEHHQVIDANNGSVLQTSKHETNDISSQNLSSQYNTVDNDGTSSTTTHSSTSQTKKTSVVQQSYYTEQQQVINQNQGYAVVNQQDQQVDQNQNLLLSNQSQGVVQNQDLSMSQQQTQNTVQNESFMASKQAQSTVQNESFMASKQAQSTVQNESFMASKQAQSTVQNESFMASDQQTQNTVQNQSFMASNQQTQTVDQTQSYSLGGSSQVNVPWRHQPSPWLCPDNNQGPGVVCHYEVASVFEYDNNYVVRPSQIVTEYCDVLVVSYAVLDVDRLQIGAYSPDEERIFAEIASLKSDKLKIILQLQYVAYYEQYITILNNDDNMNQFISSVVNYVQKWNFDGIELPIMVPQSNDNFYATSPVIKERFPLLVKNLKSNLPNDHIISVCLPIEPDYIDFAYDIPQLIKLVDWFSVITMDYNVPEQGILQHGSPLTPQTSSDPYCIDFTVNYLLSDLKVPSDKVIINLPLYGTSFVVQNYKDKNYGAAVTGRGPKGVSSNVDGFLTISELCSVTKTNWLNSPAIVTDYDDVPTLVLKVTYARSKCLGGVGIHSISMDDPEGHLCGEGVMPFTRVISSAFTPWRDELGNNHLHVINYIDKETTNKYDV